MNQGRKLYKAEALMLKPRTLLKYIGIQLR